MFSDYDVLYAKSQSWEDLVDKASNLCRGKSILSIVNKLFIGVVVYFIWQERNGRLFQNLRRSPRQVKGVIEESIRLKMMGMRF